MEIEALVLIPSLIWNIITVNIMCFWWRLFQSLLKADHHILHILFHVLFLSVFCAKFPFIVFLVLYVLLVPHIDK